MFANIKSENCAVLEAKYDDPQYTAKPVVDYHNIANHMHTLQTGLLLSKHML